MKMGLREANQKFSKAIQIVKSGGQVVLTERGKPIATRFQRSNPSMQP